MLKPEFVTYASSKADIDEAAALSIDHLILEDAQLSIRSWSEAKDDLSFKTLASLIQYCRDSYPNIVLSLQCDILFHHSKEALISSFINFVKEQSVPTIRVQDIGLLHRFSQEIPNTNLIFLSEMTHNNWMALSEISRIAKRQTLNMELPHDKIAAMQSQVDCDFECVVQGPILIQYSTRRFMAGLNPDIQNAEQKDQIHRLAQDEDYPGRRFTFLDNHHGHFMFAYFDRCLLMYFNLLADLNLKAWIFDARGEQTGYLAAVIKAYNEAWLNYSQAKDVKVDMTAINEVASRPQKPGFFKANQTDRRRYKATFMPQDVGYEKVGQLLDADKGKRISFECYKSVAVGDTLIAFHPKIDNCEILIEQLWDMNGKPIQKSRPGQLLQIPYVKGIQQHAILGRHPKLTFP